MNLLFRKRSLQTSYNNYEEEFERIRLNIEFSSFENKCKTLLFTSSNYKEGKTTTITHLATSLAENGHSVLVIDTDIKKPMIHKVFKIKNTVGLTNILTGQKNMEDTIIQTEMPRLKVLTAGPIPYSTERLFITNRIDMLLENISKEFDYVLIDSSPVLEGNDTKIFASKCDGVILVVKNGKTEDSVALEAKKILEIAKANVIGVILNAKPKGILKKWIGIFSPGRSLLRT